MADVVVEVLDAAGQPVEDADVRVEQQSHAFLFGCNLYMWGKCPSEELEQAYRLRFADLFNFATLGFYWGSYERQRGEPRDDQRRAAEWCRRHRIHTKGHPLAWTLVEPEWLPNDPQEVVKLQLGRIRREVTEYKGLIDCWDVVNEPSYFDRDQTREDSPRLTRAWERVGNIEFIRRCLATAREANPKATLLVNDYCHTRTFARVLDRLRVDGARPFDAIGLQSHMHREPWSNEKTWEVCQRFARFDVPLHFTEVTILSGREGWEAPEDEPAWPSTPRGERRQAEQVERFYTMLFSHPAVEAITWWDLSDRGAWKDAPAGLLRADMSPKPAYEVLQRLIQQTWHTRATRRTDAAGRVRLRGFLGDYSVAVETADGTRTGQRFTLRKNDENRWTIRLPDEDGPATGGGSWSSDATNATGRPPSQN